MAWAARTSGGMIVMSIELYVYGTHAALQRLRPLQARARSVAQVSLAFVGYAHHSSLSCIYQVTPQRLGPLQARTRSVAQVSLARN